MTKFTTLAFFLATLIISPPVHTFSESFATSSCPQPQTPTSDSPLQNHPQPEILNQSLHIDNIEPELNHFDHKEFTCKSSTLQESIVHLPELGIFGDDAHYQQHYDSILKTRYSQQDHEKYRDEALKSCSTDTDGPSLLKWAPTLIHTLTLHDPSVSFSPACFQDTKISLKIIDSETVEVIHENKNPSSLLCVDTYIYFTYSNLRIEPFFTSGTHRITLKVSPQEFNQIMVTGIQVFKVCKTTFGTLTDLIKTFGLFLGGLGLNPNIPFFGSKPTGYQTDLNIKFMEELMGVKWEKRPQDVVVDLDESLVQSGDFFTIFRFDGIDAIIAYGTGSLVGHGAMALRIDGELFIVESQNGWYWPEIGIQKNPYKQWIQWARNADYQVTWLPLKKEYAQKFNADAAYTKFKELEGMPYGFHNFLFGWLDTPQHSYPHLLAPETVALVFGTVEMVIPFASESIFTLALNKRLGTEGLKVPEIAIEAARRGLTLPDLYGMPEDDSWKYPDGYSLVCSSFVAAMWKAAGLFGDVKVHATEFTPRDIYQLEFIDPKPEVPENCKQVDPTNPYCQIMGGYRMMFPGISTVKAYEHMNENCQSMGPNFTRFPVEC